MVYWLIAFICFVILAPVNAQAQRIDTLVLPGYNGLPLDGGGSWFVRHLDIDNDGDLDLFVGRSHEHDQLYLNDGAGHFTRIAEPAWITPGGSHDMVKLDLNGDENEDLVLARSPASGGAALSDGHNQILLRSANGTLVEAAGNLPAGPIEPITGRPQYDVSFAMGVAAGDFNNDDLDDLVFVNGGMNYLIRLEPLKPLDGQWVALPALRNVILQNALFFQSTADDNGDGVHEFNDVSGSSGFGVFSDLSTDVVVADFNGDTLDDIFVTNFFDAPLAVFHPGVEQYVSKLFLNDPAEPGRFTWARANFPEVLRPSTSVAAADIDNDGDTDLFITNERRARGIQPNERSRLYLNNGAGVFTDATDSLLPTLDRIFHSSFDALIADINGDNRPDLFAAGIFSYILLQQPEGSFADATDRLPLHPASGLPYTFHSYGSTIADVNDDEWPDIALADTYEQNRLLLQSADGRFTDSTSVNLPPNGENAADVALGDINGDELIDIVTVNFKEPHGHSLYIQTAQEIDGYPVFRDVSQALVHEMQLNRGVEIGDANGNGRPDIMISGYDGVKLFFNAGADIGGDPIFHDSTARWLPQADALDSANKAAFFDISNDGNPDIFFPNGRIEAAGAANVLFVWDPEQNRFLDRSDWLPANNGRTLEADFADLNNDGWADILAVNEDQSLALYMSTASFPAESPAYVKSTPEAFIFNQSVAARFADVNGDTFMDIVEASSCCLNGLDSLKYAYLNTGDMLNGAPVFTRVAYGERDFQNQTVAIRDLNDDGISDIIVAGRAKVQMYIYDDASQTFADSTERYTSINSVSGLALSTYGLAVEDINGDGLTDFYLARDNQDLLFYGVRNGDVAVTPKPRRASKASLEILPNPFSERTTIVYGIDAPTYVTLEAYSILGRHLLTVVDQFHIPGRYYQTIDAQQLGSLPNAAFVRLVTDNGIVSAPLFRNR